MGEAILTRFGGVQDPNTPVMKWKLYTELITENTSYTVPTCRNQELTVMLFGGGGGCQRISTSSLAGGGGGGYYNKQVITAGAGTVVDITIGNGGVNSNGGTTSFGVYFAANGGERGYVNGGNGGAGGGAGGWVNSAPGHGFTFGGGGMAQSTDVGSTNGNVYLGSGGEYGGEGGGAWYWDYYGGSLINTKSKHNSTYGGRGGYVSSNQNGSNPIIVNPENGTELDKNNIIKDNVDMIVETNGVCGTTEYKSNSTYSVYAYGFGGGGGYGGNGGNGKSIAIYISSYQARLAAAGGGGGGGYGAKGGDGAADVEPDILTCTSSGGGGGRIWISRRKWKRIYYSISN